MSSIGAICTVGSSARRIFLRFRKVVASGFRFSDFGFRQEAAGIVGCPEGEPGVYMRPSVLKTES
jgi:hypothetical protein